MRQETIIALNRFGLGARPQEAAAADADPRGWLLRQLDAAQAAVPPAMAGLPGSRAAAENYERFVAERVQQRRKDETKAAGMEPPADGAEAFRKAFQQDFVAEINARAQQQVSTAAPFFERLVLFWANHFTVSADKPQITALAGPFEREAIRPRLLGRYADLLLAAEQHPAMLRYLDNTSSFGPQSPFASDPPRGLQKRAAKAGRSLDFGLNENLAREILELHTLGVNGGYTQADVVELAKALTGWTVDSRLLRKAEPMGPYGAMWFAAAHQPGTRSLLGRRYAEGGREQGEAVLRDLALHPATARFLSTKLARHFVADEPPPALVARLERRFLDSGGDLAAVYRALIEAPEAWAPQPRKLKRPEEFLISALRVTGLPAPRQPQAWSASLTLLGQAPLRPGSPAGWGDAASDWIGPDGLWKRMQVAEQISEKLPAEVQALPIARAALGDWLQADTVEAMQRAESQQQAAAIFLSSPEFQWR